MRSVNRASIEDGGDSEPTISRLPTMFVMSDQSASPIPRTTPSLADKFANPLQHRVSLEDIGVVSISSTSHLPSIWSADRRSTSFGTCPHPLTIQARARKVGTSSCGGNIRMFFHTCTSSQIPVADSPIRQAFNPYSIGAQGHALVCRLPHVPQEIIGTLRVDRQQESVHLQFHTMHKRAHGPPDSYNSTPSSHMPLVGNVQLEDGIPQ